MAVQNTVMRNLQANAPEIGGGMVGVGAPVALREFVDVQQGPLVTGQGDLVARATTPSVLYGLGGGALSGLLWWAGVGPNWLEDLYLAHTVTAIPTGIASAVLPKGSGGGGGGSAAGVRRTQTRRVTADGGSEFDQTGEFSPAGGGKAE